MAGIQRHLPWTLAVIAMIGVFLLIAYAHDDLWNPGMVSAARTSHRSKRRFINHEGYLPSGVIFETNVPSNVRAALPFPSEPLHRAGPESSPPPFIMPSSQVATSPATTTQTPISTNPSQRDSTTETCNSSLLRRGNWIHRPQSDPTLNLFRLPLTKWYLPETKGCDFPIIAPKEACRCLHKVAFIGDSITMGFFQIFAEYITQKENIILRRNFSAAEDTKDCFGGPLYDETGHIRYKPCIPLMEPHIYDQDCDLRVHYLRINKYMPGKDGTEKELKLFLTQFQATDSLPVEIVVLNFGLHHMVAWNERILATYPMFVRRALEVTLEAAPSSTVIWMGITAQHVAKKPAQWRRLQSNERVLQFNSAAFHTIQEAKAKEGTFSRVTIWDVFPMTEPPEADVMSWDGVHYVRHMNTMRTLILLSYLFEPGQKCSC